MDRSKRLPLRHTVRRRSGAVGFAGIMRLRLVSIAAVPYAMAAVALAVPESAHPADPPPAIAPADVADALQSAMRGSAYQTELPGPDVQRVDNSPAQPLGDPVDLPPDLPATWETPQALGTVAEVLLWTLAAVALIVLCFWLTGLIPGRRPAPADDGMTAPDAADGGMPAGGLRGGLRDALAMADRLAAQGDYDGAIHCLLLAALESLRKVLGQPIAPSLTGREVVDRTDLSSGVQGALRTLVMSVEISRFGGQSADADMYGDCRESYRQVSAAAGPAA